MGAKTEELIEVLSRLTEILNRDKNYHWAQWMNSAKSRLVNSGYSGIEKFLSAYGGMGSFNDVYIKEISRENEKFSELSTKAWNLANEIKQDHETNT